MDGNNSETGYLQGAAAAGGASAGVGGSAGFVGGAGSGDSAVGSSSAVAACGHDAATNGTCGGAGAAYFRIHRHTPQNIKAIEAYITNLPSLDQSERNQIAWVLGLDPQLVNFWYENKPTQGQNVDVEIEVLQIENEVVRSLIQCNEAESKDPCLPCIAETNNLMLENHHIKESLELLTKQLQVMGLEELSID